MFLDSNNMFNNDVKQKKLDSTKKIGTNVKVFYRKRRIRKFFLKGDSFIYFSFIFFILFLIYNFIVSILINTMLQSYSKSNR